MRVKPSCILSAAMKHKRRVNPHASPELAGTNHLPGNRPKRIGSGGAVNGVTIRVFESRPASDLDYYVFHREIPVRPSRRVVTY